MSGFPHRVGRAVSGGTCRGENPAGAERSARSMIAIRVVLFSSQREKAQVILDDSARGALKRGQVRRWDRRQANLNGARRIESWPVSFRAGSPPTTWGRGHER